MSDTTIADVKSELPRDTLEHAARMLASYRFDYWNWGDSTGFEALLKASALLDDDWYAGVAYGAFKAWAHSPRQLVERDNTAPGHALCLCYEKSGDAELVEVAMRLATFLRTRRRNSAGAYTVTERALLRPAYGTYATPPAEAVLLVQPGPAVYVDELHMTPPFLVHLGNVLSHDELIDDGAQEALALVRLLQDEKSGLMWHFWLEDTDSRYCHGWGRGQGWAMLGLLDVLRFLPAGHSAREELEQRVQRLISSLISAQRPDGNWSTLVDVPESGAETSTAAFAVTAIARASALGLTDEAMVHAMWLAWKNTCQQVDERGILRGVSAGVYASTNPKHYYHVTTGHVVPWGQGTLLLAAHEVQRSSR